MSGKAMVLNARRAAGRITIGFLLLAVPGTLQAQMGDMRGSMPMGTWEPTWFLLADQLELSPQVEGRPIGVDIMSWYGGSHQRLWVRAQGDIGTSRRQGEAEAQVLYGRLVDPWWDAVVGIRVDRGWGPENTARQFLAAGLMGLAPYRFELAPTVFVSTKGEISGRLEASYQLLFTQRLILEPETELNVALQDVPAYGIRRGFNDYEVGARLRYELRREFAPYVGISRARRVGEVPDAGTVGPTTRTHLELGLRLWR